MGRLEPLARHRLRDMGGECHAAVVQRFHHQPIFVEGEATGCSDAADDIIRMVNDVQHIDPEPEFVDEA
jgi:hypothetical protein